MAVVRNFRVPYRDDQAKRQQEQRLPFLNRSTRRRHSMHVLIQELQELMARCSRHVFPGLYAGLVENWVLMTS